jgi:hypothetical protein
MLEYWNEGIMGTGKMGQCFIGEMPLKWKLSILVNDKLPY